MFFSDYLIHFGQQSRSSLFSESEVLQQLNFLLPIRKIQHLEKGIPHIYEPHLQKTQILIPLDCASWSINRKVEVVVR